MTGPANRITISRIPVTMRIAIVRRSCSLKKAGAERYCVNLFRNLQKLGHEVTILGEEIDDELRQEVGFVKVPVNRLTSWTRNRSFARNSGALAKAGGYDVVHGLSRAEGLDTCRLTDPLQTHWVNVYYRHPLERWIQKQNPRHRALFELERGQFGPGGARRIITQSRLDTRLLQEYFGVAPERIRQISNGVDLATFHPSAGERREEIRDALGIPRDVPLLAFAGMDFRRKGLGSLLTALSRCRSRETRLVVYGSGAIPAYRRLAARLKVADRVVFAGRRQDMPACYAAADLFVLPTIYEPFPNVNLEAMATGTPVVTTRTAGGADLVIDGQNGYLVSSAQAIDELTDSIDYHLNLASETVRKMSVFSRQTAERFPLEENARQTAAVLEEAYREKLAA